MQPEQHKKITHYFILESQEHLQTIESGLLNLAATLQNTEIVDELFRAAHSIKGGAAMLGLTSIQTISHRLEDYFKIFQDSSFTPDQKLEAYFLSLFITLQELIEELSSQKGLTPEVAQNALSKVEPVFKQLEDHLNNLIAAPKATVAEDGEIAPMASRHQQNQQTVDQHFHKQVLLCLKEMLRLYKQPDSAENRQKWQEYCQDLADLGQERDLAPWVLLLEASKKAIANAENSYRSCAGVIIKEIKQAREKIVAGSSQEITITEQLQVLLPVEQSKTPNRAPEVGMAAINSLADLFEEKEAPDLENTWQVEEVIERETSGGEFGSQETSFEEEEEQERDFDELFLDLDEEDDISSAENLVNLFEDDFEEISTSSSLTTTNGKVDPSERLDEVADLNSSSSFASDSDTEDFSFATEETATTSLDESAFSFTETEEEDPGDDLNALFADIEEEGISGTVEQELNEEEQTDTFDNLDTLFELDESETQISNANEEVLDIDTAFTNEEDSDSLALEETAAFGDLFALDSEEENANNFDDFLEPEISSFDAENEDFGIQPEQDSDSLNEFVEPELGEETNSPLTSTDEAEDFDDLLDISSDSSVELSLDDELPSSGELENFDDLLAIGSDDSQEWSDWGNDDIPTGALGFGELLDSENTQTATSSEVETNLSSISAIESFDLDAFADSQEDSDFTELNDLFEEEIARESSELDNTFSEPREDHNFSFNLDAPEQDIDGEELAEINSTEVFEEDFTVDTLDLSDQSSELNSTSEDDFSFDTNSSLEELSLDL